MDQSCQLFGLHDLYCVSQLSTQVVAVLKWVPGKKMAVFGLVGEAEVV
jgi:hypothetical protein